VFQFEVFAFDVAEVIERFRQDPQADILFLCASRMPEHANAPYFPGLLGLYGKRIRYRRATKKREEVAPFHYSARPMLADAI